MGLRWTAGASGRVRWLVDAVASRCETNDDVRGDHDRSRSYLCCVRFARGNSSFVVAGSGPCEKDLTIATKLAFTGKESPRYA